MNQGPNPQNQAPTGRRAAVVGGQAASLLPRRQLVLTGRAHAALARRCAATIWRPCRTIPKICRLTSKPWPVLRQAPADHPLDLSVEVGSAPGQFLPVGGDGFGCDQRRECLQAHSRAGEGRRAVRSAKGELRLDRLDELGEVAGHRPFVAAAQLDLVAGYSRRGLAGGTNPDATNPFAPGAVRAP